MNSTAITQRQMSYGNFGPDHVIMENDKMKSEKQNHRTFTSISKTVGLKTLSVAAGLIALIGVCFTPQAAVAQPLQIDCYTFDALLGEDPFTIGESLATDEATINITNYFRNGVPVSPDPAAQFAQVRSSMFSGDNPPELHTNLVNVQVVPNTPVIGVSLRYGRPDGSGVRFANLGINGELSEVDGAITRLR